jgi:hypothetical protein
MENIILAYVGLVAVTLYWANNVNEDHSALKTIAKVLSVWLIYGGMGLIRGYSEVDALTATITPIMDVLFLAYGVFVILVTAYLLIVPPLAALYSANRPASERDNGEI